MHKQEVITRLKRMANLNISEKHRPQYGKILYKRYAPLDIELRVAIISTVPNNEDLVMRIIQTISPVTLGEVGMNEEILTGFTDLIASPCGIVMVVGPSRNAMPIILRATLEHINKPETKIWTIEDPVETAMEGIRQVEINPETGPDFAEAMKAVLLGDPDVIVIPEIRDVQMASLAIEAALKGLLVLTGIHARSAAEALTHILETGVSPRDFSNAILGVLSQGFVRVLCTERKEEYHPSKDQYDRLIKAYRRENLKGTLPFMGSENGSC